jgi:NMD protein affecting ribosome stability and mRNA decay
MGPPHSMDNLGMNIQLLKSVCNKKIEQLCKHEFVEDAIDINPDKSQNIRYCSICEYTDPNY